MEARGTGRLVNHDPRNRDYEAPRRAVRPTSWLHSAGPVLDQASYNGCVGWTFADFLNSSLAVGNRRRYWGQRTQPNRSAYLGDDQGLELYKLATRNDPFSWTYPPTDNGSSALGGAKALKAAGVIDGYDWTFDFGQALAHAQRQPVLIGIVWTDPMSDPDKAGVIHVGTDRDIKRAVDDGLGHEVLWRGVRWDRKLARIRNHWTKDWGLGGDALIPIAELERLIADYKGDVCVPRLA